MTDPAEPLLPPAFLFSAQAHRAFLHAAALGDGLLHIPEGLNAALREDLHVLAPLFAATWIRAITTPDMPSRALELRMHADQVAMQEDGTACVRLPLTRDILLEMCDLPPENSPDMSEGVVTGQ